MSKFRPGNRWFWLAQLFESNYRKLSELIPDLTRLRGNAIAFSYGKPALQLTLVERSRYTLTLDLNYCFDSDHRRSAEPRFRIRVYLDGKCAEALHPGNQYSASDTAGPHVGHGSEILEAKWTSNYFLDRWLNHCLNNQYRFEFDTITEQPAAVA